MITDTPIHDIPETGKETGGLQINFKRVLALALDFWYLILISIIVALTVAFLINRYSTKIYPVRASIMIKESEENIGAKFLYSNALLNPSRNFANEMYIMKSYPLLREVMESLHFDVSYFREGDLKTTEYYDPDFPIEFQVLKGGNAYGKSMYFKVNKDQTFSLQNIVDKGEAGKKFENLNFNDTIPINGFSVFAKLKGDLSEIVEKNFVVSFNDPLSLAKSYSARLNTTWAQQGASVVNLEIYGEVPRKEMDFLNEFIERYQFYDVGKKNRVTTMAIRFLDEQLQVVGDSLKLYEEQVERFKRRNIITTLGAETNRLYWKIQEFENQKLQYLLQENYFEYIGSLLSDAQYEGIFTPSSVGITDGVVSALINELIALKTEVAVYRDNPGVQRMRDNPRLQDKLRQIEMVKENILKTIQNTRATQKINIRFIDNQIKLVEGQLAKLPTTERELVTIQRNYALRENLYVVLLQKRTEAGLSKASTTSDIEVVNPPMAEGFVSPRVMRNYGMAAGAGLLFPFLVFVLLELLNNRVQSREDIENITSVPVIGGVGHNPVLEPLVVHQKPRSAIAESFRALRSNLNYFTGNQDHKVFMITSSIPGEGKSFTTMNLATVFALAGKRTLIVGGDLRKARLFEELMMNNKVGLSQYLSGMATREEVVQKTDIDHLYVIVGGAMPPNPSELLLRPAMASLINSLKEEFDFIIIDTPPLAFVADAFVLSTYADHSLFVVRQDFTPKAALVSLEDYYSTGKLASISVLFNDVQKTGLGYGYGYNSYGYRYNGQRKGVKSNEYYSD